MIRDQLFRIGALVDTLIKQTFPVWAVGIHPREEGKQYWHAEKSGIRWQVEHSPVLPHYDHLEMSGFEISAIVSYGVDKRGRLRLYRHLTWPRLRKWPNNTQASFSYNFNGFTEPKLSIDEKLILLDQPCEFVFDGILTINGKEGDLDWQRCFFPDANHPVFHEKLEIKNNSSSILSLHFEGMDTTRRVHKKKGHGTCFIVTHKCDHPAVVDLEPGGAITLHQIFCAADADQHEAASVIDPKNALAKRQSMIYQINHSLMLECGDPELDLAFQLTKLRASESIFRTKNGLMHGPGGGEYYAALWTNDQCEYVNPYFAWSGYGPGLEQAMNCYRLYAALMDPDSFKPLPTSIIAEGEDIWNGAGDRGDAAMYAQGAGRFLLTAGRRDWIDELLPAIDWCLQWCERHRIDGSGPVSSDSDELEGRFPSGAANLATSVLYYDALVSRAHLAHTLDDLKDVDLLSDRAEEMRRVIETHFGAAINGFETYRYFEGCSILRSWICLPLTAGIHDRANDTLVALFSPRLWTINGLRTAANSNIVWDRSTLFALRGAFAAGATEEAWQKLREYTAHRLLGAHVPYPSEAYPEGNRRHLSAESGLYCRIFIEGMFGLRPTGLRSFDWTPHLPESQPGMALRCIAAFGAVDADGNGLLDLEVERSAGGHLRLLASLSSHVFFEETIRPGQTVHVTLPERQL